MDSTMCKLGIFYFSLRGLRNQKFVIFQVAAGNRLGLMAHLSDNLRYWTWKWIRSRSESDSKSHLLTVVRQLGFPYFYFFGAF